MQETPPPSTPLDPADAEKETGRIEAFSDGVFAIAITLLVLDLKVPRPQPDHSLLQRLLEEWPALMAYLTSFVTILVMWVNHHRMFRCIRRTDDPFLFLNGFLLLLVTFVPFPTSIVALYLRQSEARPADARTAGLVYAGTYVVIAIAFNVLWRYAARRRRLIGARVSDERIREISRLYAPGIPIYLVACGLALYSAWASVGLCLLLAVFFASTGRISARAANAPL